MNSRGSGILFAVIAFAALSSSKAQSNNGYNLSVTSKTEDYIIQNKRQYVNNIKLLEAQVAEFKESYNNRIKTVAFQTNLLEAKLREVDEQLNPLELVDELSKHCVQKYRGQIVTLSSVQQRTASCVNKGTNALPAMITSLEATLANLKQYHNQHLPSYLDTCRTKNPASHLNYTMCVMEKIKAANVATSNSMNEFSNKMKQSSCSGGFQVKETVDCSFNIVFGTVSQIGDTMRLIENCIQGKEFCPPCTEVLPTTSNPQIGSKCHQVGVPPYGVDRINSTIENPFAKLNPSVTCVQFNILQPV